MNTVTGSGATLLQRTGAEHQMLFYNTDGASVANVKVNGDPTGFSVEAWGKRGWRVNKGFYTVQITTAGTWEATFE